MRLRIIALFVLGFILPISVISQTVETFTTSGSWICPAGVTSITVECWGGGGAGGRSYTTNAGAGGGGAGGAYAKKVVSVTSGNTYTVNVAAAKSSSTTSNLSTDNTGNPSWFSTTGTIYAQGGAGGVGVTTAANGSGGTGSSALSIGDLGFVYAGGNGAIGARGSGNLGGAGGGGAGSTGIGNNAVTGTGGASKPNNGGAGANGPANNTNGTNGSNYGAGGSGGKRRDDGIDRNGGAGAPGLVNITYTCPTYSISSTSGSSPVGAGSSSIVMLTSSAAGLPVGTYTVTYNLSAPNAATGLTATMTISSAGSGSFNTSSLVNAGSTTVTITSLESGTPGSCASAIGINNTSVITVTYCTPAPTSVDGTGITNITFGTINNTTGDEAGHYGNYSAQSTSVSQGESATVNITYSTGFTYDTKIWVDWNNDMDFGDAGEEVYSGTSGSSNPTTLAASITVPVDATIGNHRMRIGGQDNGPCTPCYTGTYGTYEDYTIDVTAALPMTFSSCTTTQTNITSVAPSALSQEIIGIQVVTTGAATPLTASSFTFNTTGSTAAANIANAKLWSTGTSSAFATTTQLGSATVSPSGSFTITGGVNMPYTLATGINYFWLTYDIIASPTLNDVVDAECTSITIGTAKTPTETAPTGSRVIALNYCSPTYASGGSNDNITHVVLETLDDTPPANNTPYYFNRTASQSDIPTLNIGQTHTLSVTFGTDGTQYTRAWIDFNQDGDFDDAGESFDGGNPGASGTANISMAIPGGALSGQTRMRIRGGDDSSIGAGQSCGASSSSYGQSVDYYVNIAAAVNMSYVSSTSTQVNTNIISTGTTNQEIICMKVVTSGSLNPLSATEFRMRTDGTTAYGTDIRNAKIWFTGNSSTFSATTQFGSTVATPSASGIDMVFTDNQTLSPGTNYFWMTYDVPSAAVNGNFADAKFQSVVVGGATQTPTVSAPVENREIIRGCFYTLTLKDDNSNGWDDNTLTVKVNGVTRLNNVTYSSGYTYTFQFIAETGQTITTEYTAGTSSSDKSYFITNPNGAYVLSSGEAQTVPVNKSATADCNAVKEFTTNSDTYQSGKSCFIITEDKTSKNGSVWSNYKIDMTQNFTIEFDLYLGDDPDGADGVVFALQGSCASAGGDGSSIGFGGINNSIGVEFDTFYNGTDTDDPSSQSDHIAIISDGSADHGLSSNLSGPIDVTNMEDNAWHSAKVEWNATTRKFSVTYGGSEIMSYTGDIVTNLFAGNSQVFWGFTGSTGGASNKQQVCVTSYPQNTTQVGDTAIDLGASVSVQVAANASSYTWIPNDGSVSDPTAHNPILTPTATTEYTCLLEDGCGNIITNKFTVQIKSTLPVELLDFKANCTNKGVDLIWSTASETNNSHFILEKTTDFVTYTHVATVTGAGNSTSLNSYRYSDGENQGMTYYRLSQVDFDGNKSLFNSIAVECNPSGMSNMSIGLFPNPASEWFSLELPGKTAAKVQIFTVTGLMVNELADISAIDQINIANLSKGVYIVKVFFENEIYYCKLNKH